MIKMNLKFLEFFLESRPNKFLSDMPAGPTDFMQTEVSLPIPPPLPPTHIPHQKKKKKKKKKNE